MLEFVKLYNSGGTEIDLSGLVLSDGDELDALKIFPGTTVVEPGDYAVIVDAGYDGSYPIDSGIPFATTGDTNPRTPWFVTPDSVLPLPNVYPDANGLGRGY